MQSRPLGFYFTRKSADISLVVFMPNLFCYLNTIKYHKNSLQVDLFIAELSMTM